MPARTIVSIEQGRQIMEDGIALHEASAAYGTNTEDDQGENWVREDPREWAFLSSFMAHMRKTTGADNHVVLGGSSDGLVAQTLAEEGFAPTGIEASAAMTTAARRRLASLGLHGTFYEGDLTRLDTAEYPATFAGAALLHVANCIPVAGENDDLLQSAVANLSVLAPEGAFAFSHTYYPEDVHYRTIYAGDEPLGEVPYYYRSAAEITAIFRNVGRGVGLVRHHNDRGVGGSGEDYQNDYYLAGPVHS